MGIQINTSALRCPICGGARFIISVSRPDVFDFDQGIFERAEEELNLHDGIVCASMNCDFEVTENSPLWAQIAAAAAFMETD